MEFIKANMWWLITLIVLFTVIVVIGSRLLESRQEDQYYNFLSAETQHYIESKKEQFFVTYIDGRQGKGKTTFASGLTNALTFANMNLLRARMKRATITFHDLNFLPIKEIIDKSFDEGDSIQECFAKVLEEFPEFFDNIDNHLKIVKGTAVLRQFIDAMYAYKRNNFVMYSNTEENDFVSYANGQTAMHYDPSFINLKDIYKSGEEFKIPRYCIIFEDEKQNSGKDCYRTFEIAKQDTGASIFFEYIRHLGDGTMYYITTDQTFAASFSGERKLATSIVRILDREDLAVKKTRNKFYDLRERFINWRYDRKTRKSEFPIIFDKSKLRSKLFKIQQRKNEIFADGFVQYKVRIYHAFDDVGKKIEASTFDAEERYFTFPTKSVYGSVDTVAFGFLYDKLNPRLRPEYILPATTEEVTNQILRKKDEGKEKKKTKAEREKEKEEEARNIAISRAEIKEVIDRGSKHEN